MILYNNVFAGSANKEVVKVTYDELLNLKNNGKLDTDVVYQLTDYVDSDFKTYSVGNILTSGTNYFDLLLTALDDSNLATKAGATMHDGIDYYTEDELSQYELIYYINGDSIPSAYRASSIFSFTSDNKGYILSLKDQFNNKVNFNFKNVLINDYHLFDFGNRYDWTDSSLIRFNSSLYGYSHDNDCIIDFNYTKIGVGGDHGCLLTNCKINNSIITGVANNVILINSAFLGTNQQAWQSKLVNSYLIDSILDNSGLSDSGLYSYNINLSRCKKIRLNSVAYNVTGYNCEEITLSNNIAYNCHLTSLKTQTLDVSGTSQQFTTYFQSANNVTKIIE